MGRCRAYAWAASLGGTIATEIRELLIDLPDAALRPVGEQAADVGALLWTKVSVLIATAQRQRHDPGGDSALQVDLEKLPIWMLIAERMICRR